jgi:hypothetical protein
MATREELIEILKKINKIYGDRFTLNAEVVSVWLKAFSDISAVFIEKGLQKFIETDSRVPTLADIRNKTQEFCSARFTKKGYTVSKSRQESHEEALVRSGLIKVISYDEESKRYNSRWIKKEFCINVNGKWEEKIDLILRAFPPNEWNEEILRLLNISNPEGVSYYELVGKMASDPEVLSKYKELRDRYSTMAKESLEAA